MDNKGLKEIAELAVLGCKRNPQAHTTQECMNCEFHPHSCNQWEHAEKAINAGYQKIQEDSIVLSKEEYDGLKKQVHALEHLATCYSEQIDWDNDASKETAKEIIKEVKAFLDMQTKTVNELSNSDSRYTIPESCRDCNEGSQKNRIAM